MERCLFFSIFDFYTLILPPDFEAYPVVFIILVWQNVLFFLCQLSMLFQHVRSSFWISKHFHWIPQVLWKLLIDPGLCRKTDYFFWARWQYTYVFRVGGEVALKVPWYRKLWFTSTTRKHLYSFSALVTICNNGSYHRVRAVCVAC